jgi:hypothetical protein
MTEVMAVNLCAHDIVLCNNAEESPFAVIRPTGRLCRVETMTIGGNWIGSIPYAEVVSGDIRGLPEPRDGVVYVVSSLVAQRCPDRKDVFAPDTSPAGAVRDAWGNIIGVKRLIRYRDIGRSN